MKSTLLMVLVATTFPAVAAAQGGTLPIAAGPINYQAIRTWHEQHLASSPSRAARVDALRTIVRSGTLGERGLRRIFNHFENRMAIDPSIPGVETTARLLASSNRAQVKGHTRELLYAIRLHNDGRNQLVGMSRKLDRPWGKTDADIVIRNRVTGLYGRIEVKDYSLRSQNTNEVKLKVQMDKMAREGRLTGQPQFWINRHGITPQLRSHAGRAGVVTMEHIATGRRLPPNVQPFDSALARMDAQFGRVARDRAIAGGSMIGIGVTLLAYTLPEAWVALEAVTAPGPASTDARLRLASSGSYSLGAAGLVASGSALAFAPRFGELVQNRLFGFAKVGGLTAVAALGMGVAIDVQRYRIGALTSERLWQSALKASVQFAGAAAGGWLGGSLAGLATANPLAATAGGVAGSTVGAAAVQVADGTLTHWRMENQRARLDEAFGDAVKRRYAIP